MPEEKSKREFINSNRGARMRALYRLKGLYPIMFNQLYLEEQIKVEKRYAGFERLTPFNTNKEV